MKRNLFLKNALETAFSSEVRLQYSRYWVFATGRGEKSWTSSEIRSEMPELVRRMSES